MKPVICIPSYKRPDGVAIERLKKIKGLDKYLFVRVEEKPVYSVHADDYKIVGLKRVNDIGETRRDIIRYLHSKGIKWAFMFDDDIMKVEMLGEKPDGTLTSQRIIDGSLTKPRFEAEALKLWFSLAKKHGLSLSSPNHRAYDRRHHGNKIRINNSAIIQAVLINVEDAMEVGNYRSINETGNEDYYLQYLLMKAGKLTGKVCMMEYDCPPMGKGKGGNNEVEKNTMEERYKKYIGLFQKNVCSDDTLVATKVTTSGIPSLKFVWKSWGSSEINLEE